jgi:hypothetical protein
MTDFYEFKCPHCQGDIIVHKNEINCCIFRHAILKSNYQQIDPHLPKDKCDALVREDLVYGCAKPFRIRIDNHRFVIEICDYI